METKMYEINIKGDMRLKELCATCVKAWTEAGATVTESEEQDDAWGSCEDDSCSDIVY